MSHRSIVRTYHGAINLPTNPSKAKWVRFLFRFFFFFHQTCIVFFFQICQICSSSVLFVIFKLLFLSHFEVQKLTILAAVGLGSRLGGDGGLAYCYWLIGLGLGKGKGLGLWLVIGIGWVRVRG
jgi:hypothetical protein